MVDLIDVLGLNLRYDVGFVWGLFGGSFGGLFFGFLLVSPLGSF